MKIPSRSRRRFSPIRSTCPNETRRLGRGHAGRRTTPGFVTADALGEPLPKDRAHVVVVPQAADRYLGTWLPAPGLRTEPLAAARRKASGEAIAETALMFLDAPYQWGGVTVVGLDCSGLVQTVHRRFGLLLPRNADQQETPGERCRCARPSRAICSATAITSPSGLAAARSCTPPRSPARLCGEKHPAELKARLRTVRRRVRGRRLIAWCAIDVRSGRTIGRNHTRVMPAASTIKVLISVALWEAVAAGALDSAARVPVAEMTPGDPDGAGYRGSTPEPRSPWQISIS